MKTWMFIDGSMSALSIHTVSNGHRVKRMACFNSLKRDSKFSFSNYFDCSSLEKKCRERHRSFLFSFFSSFFFLPNEFDFVGLLCLAFTSDSNSYHKRCLIIL